MKRSTLLVAVILLCNTSFAQTITTIAGTGTAGYSGTGGPATAAQLDGPAHIVVDHSGNIYFTDFYNNLIRKIDTSGIIENVAGDGSPGYTGDGYSASSASLNGPNGFSSDIYGNLYVADEYNSAIRKIDASGIITTIAGTGSSGYNGDGISATSAKLNQPTDAIADDSGNVYIADLYNSRLRKINTAGIISTIAGTGLDGYSGDNGPATAAAFNGLGYLDFNNLGNLYVIDQANQRVRVIDKTGIVTTTAGDGLWGYVSDGVPATAAELYNPSMTAHDYSGRLWIVDAYNNRVRMVDSLGIIHTMVGNGTSGYMGDHGPATAAELNQPWGITFDDCGNLYIGDALNNVVRKVTYFTGMPSISGPMTVGTGASINLGIALGGGTWSSGSPSVATVGSGTGIVTGLTIGTTVISFTNMCGTSTYTISVHSSLGVQNVSKGSTISVIPNPNNGEFIINGTSPEISGAKEVTLEIMDLTGRQIFNTILQVDNGSINKSIRLDNNIGNGLYVIKLKTENFSEAIQFSLSR